MGCSLRFDLHCQKCAERAGLIKERVPSSQHSGYHVILICVYGDAMVSSFRVAT